jgi:cytochrome c-type biogenesis protein CcmF
MPFGPILAWKRGDFYGTAQRLLVAIGCGIGGILVFAALRGGPVVSVMAAGLAVFAFVGSFADLSYRLFGRSRFSVSNVWGRARGLPRSVFGTAFAHAGLAITLLGLAATGWGVEKVVSLKPGEAIELGPYELVVESVLPDSGPNYSERVAHTAIRSGGVTIAAIDPAIRFYPTRRMSRTEAGIATIGFGQIYMSLGGSAADGKIDTRLYWKPFVTLIWLGALVMGFGGLVSLSDRRLRIGIAQRARRLVVANAQPAE